MTHTFENQTFGSFYERGDHRVHHVPASGRPIWYTCDSYVDFEFRRCSFQGCGISVTRDPQKRSTFRNIRLIDCDVRGCAAETAILEDIYVERLKTHNLLACWGAVFKHVTLKGRIGSIMVNPAVATGTAKREEQHAFDEANAAYYASVDWALDISEAEFEVEPDIRNIPARLIRRDADTQVVVTREKALKYQAALDSLGTYWGRWIGLFLSNPWKPADVVIAAPTRHRRYAELLEGITLLREAGIAEPD